MGKTIKSYKGFNEDMTCKGFKYTEGEIFETNEAKSCKTGFHACPYPLDVFNYYPPGTSVYHEVEQSGKLDESESDKVCSTKIKIGVRLDIIGMVKAAIEYVKERCTNIYNTKEGEPATAGSYGAATARGKSSSGKNGLSVARGNGVAVKGGLGAILVIAEEAEDSYKIKDWLAVEVDGINIKADTWYKLEEGTLKECKEE